MAFQCLKHFLPATISPTAVCLVQRSPGAREKGPAGGRNKSSTLPENAGIPGTKLAHLLSVSSYSTKAATNRHFEFPPQSYCCNCTYLAGEGIKASACRSPLQPFWALCVLYVVLHIDVALAGHRCGCCFCVSFFPMAIIVVVFDEMNVRAKYQNGRDEF